MKNKLEAIDWLMQQTYDEYDWNDELIKGISIVMEEKQDMFNDDEMLGIYMCASRRGYDWRKILADYKEFNKQ